MDYLFTQFLNRDALTFANNNIRSLIFLQHFEKYQRQTFLYVDLYKITFSNACTEVLNLSSKVVTLCNFFYIKALCNGKPTPLGGCTEKNPTDAIQYRGGGSRNEGGGTCISPGQCADCKDGFYVDGALCTSKSMLTV